MRCTLETTRTVTEALFNKVGLEERLAAGQAVIYSEAAAAERYRLENTGQQQFDHECAALRSVLHSESKLQVELDNKTQAYNAMGKQEFEAMGLSEPNPTTTNWESSTPLFLA